MKTNHYFLEIIILNYNTSLLTTQLIKSLVNKKPKEWIITLIDNHSRPDQQREIKKLAHQFNINLILNSQNLGFAKANNLALKKSRSEYILLLNSDIQTNISTIQRLLDFIATNKKIGAVSPKLILPSGNLDWACHRGFPTIWSAFTYFSKLEKLFPRFPLFSEYHQKYKSLDQPHQVDAISGAFFLARRSALKKVGYFDEDYFMYGEDIDLCYRLKKTGYQIWYYPLVQAIHLKHQSGIKSNSSRSVQKSRDYFYQAMAIFYQKHYAHRYPSFLNWGIKQAIKLLSKSNFK